MGRTKGSKNKIKYDGTPGPGRPKGAPNKNHISLVASLRAIVDATPGNMPPIVTNADVLAERLWNFALTASPSNPKAFNGIVEVFDRCEGKSAPAPAELAAIKDSRAVIVLPRVIQDDSNSK